MRWPERLLGSPPAPRVPPGYRLRRYAEADLEAYIALMHRAGFDGWHAERVAEVLPMVVPDGFLLIEHLETSRLAATAVANHRPRPEYPFGGEMGWVAADPDHRGRGLGLAICSAATARLLRGGYRNVYLLTDDWRLAAIKIYLRLGYEPVLAAPGMRARWRAVGDQLDWPISALGDR